MPITKKQIEAGQAVYTRRNLGLYDLFVLGLSNRFVWKCPTPRLVAHYNQYVTANHLDVGVGTGYFLDHCRLPAQQRRIALMDLNSEALAYTALRIARYQPETYRHNVLEPIAVQLPKFDSIGVNYLLHCLPGSIATKAVIFDHLHAVMNLDAVLFGATLLQGDVPRSPLAKCLMSFYNRKGIFSNQGDDVTGLEQALFSRFREVSVEVVGCAALFSARA